MQARNLAKFVIAVFAAMALSGSSCVKNNPGGPAPKPLNLSAVDQAITDASGGTSGTTIYTNVINFSGGSCVEAATRRGQAIADALETSKANGDIPADHTVSVHTYSGYRVPGWEYSSLHTYTVTQVNGSDGKPLWTWVSDNYLGPSSVKRYPGSGGYDDWSDVMTSPVKPTQPHGVGSTGGTAAGGPAAGGHHHAEGHVD